MAIAQLTTQIDPTSGLIAYVQAIKPYHSKILDVLVEYVVSDTISATITEAFKLDIHQTDPYGDKDVVYTCGFGYVWDLYGQTNPALLPKATIVKIDGDPHNKFTVTMPVQTSVSVVISSAKANQLVMVTPYKIVAVDSPNMMWTVTGNVTTRSQPGDIFFISSNDPSTNGKYTVASSVFNSASNTTVVTTVEPISLLAAARGMYNIPIDVESLPMWPAGAAVQLTTTGQMPSPLNATDTYYFKPANTLGLFNLSSVRYPTEYSDIVDLTTGGNGELRIVRTEPFVPGEFVQVAGTSGDDGQYTVNTIKKVGSNFEITVLQRVPVDQPSAAGMMTYMGSYGDPYCPIADAPPMHAETYIYERLVFDFGPHPSNPSYDPPPYDVDFA